MKIPLESLIPQQVPPPIEEGEFIKDLRERLTSVWQEAMEKMDKGRLKIAAKCEKDIRTIDIKVGDAVLYRDKHGATGKA